METLYPLRFEPLLRRYLWGGRRLQTLLGKPLGEGQDYAESWEVVDHGGDQSIVRRGPLAGQSLHALVTNQGSELLGRHDPLPRFPLLLKFLDAHRNLSVQVHPDDHRAARLDPPDDGKTEAWVVLHAEPGSVIYAGLKRGFDRPAIERELNRGTVELCLHRFTPQVGDCVFVPAGTVHALGGGIVVAEIQQSSDTTFRLFDWNRAGPDGQPRPLHVAAALEAIDYDIGPVSPQTPRKTEHAHIERLVSCDKFWLDRWTCEGEYAITDDKRFHILVVLEGSAELAEDPSGKSLLRGQTVLLPASRGPLQMACASDTVLLDIYLP